MLYKEEKSASLYFYCYFLYAIWKVSYQQYIFLKNCLVSSLIVLVIYGLDMIDELPACETEVDLADHDKASWTTDHWS